MATRRKIVYEVGAETQQAVNAFSAFGQKLKDALTTGLGVDLVRRFNDGLARLGREFQQAIERGVAFNSTLEDSAVGIAAVLKQFQPEKFRDFNDAIAESARAIDLLKEKAKQSPATFQQLVAAFQANAGAAMSANIELRKQVDLVVLMSQALAGLGIRSEQIIQESRALLTGNINEDAAAARILGITRAQVESAREQGQLFEFLTSKLSAFAEAGKVSATNLTTLKSNLQDLFDQIAGQVAKPTFDALKNAIQRLTETIGRPGFGEDLAAFGFLAAQLVKTLGTVAVWAAEAMTTLSRMLGVVADFWEDMTTHFRIGQAKVLQTLQEGVLGAAKTFNKIPFVENIDTKSLAIALTNTMLEIDRLEENLADRREAREARAGRALKLPDKAKADDAGAGANSSALSAQKAAEFLDEINEAYRKAALSRQRLLEDEYNANVARARREISDHEEKEIAILQLTATYQIEREKLAKEGSTKELGALREEAARQEHRYQQSLEETNNLFEAGSIRQIEAVRRNNRAIEEYREGLLSLLEILRALALTQPELPGIAEEIMRIEETLTRLKGAVQDESFLGTLRRNLRNLADEWSAIGKNIANLMTNSLGRAVDGVSASIMGMIDGTQTWGQVFANVARSIVSDMIRVVVQWVAQMTIVRALRKIMDIEQVASAAQRTAAEAPGAVMASIGSYGAAAAVGIAALLAGLAVGIAAFASGGLVRGAGGPREDRNLVAVSDGEYIVSAAAVDQYGLGFLEAVNSQALGASGAVAAGGGGNVSVSPAPVNVAVINNKAQLREFLRSNEGRQVMVDEVTAMKMEMGLQS